jgi:hypothetical protein
VEVVFVKMLLPAAVLAGAGIVALAPTASAAAPEPMLVHASPANDCRLNVRAGTDVGSSLLGTLTCLNYTTCAHAADVPCGPYVTGGVYTCVGADGKQLTDNRWAEVSWRTPQQSYVAAGCAAFRA